MSERHIKNLDVIVHPEYSALHNRPLVNTDRNTLRESWLERAREISTDESHALIYFSNFLYYYRRPFKPGAKTSVNRNSSLYEVEKARIKALRGLLGDRFVLLSGTCEPRAQEIRQAAEKHGLKTGKSTKMTAYGEYLELCVEVWAENTARALGIATKNISLSADLSVSQLQELQLSSRQASF